MKLSEERKAELREVKECCKVNLPEFKEQYNKLDKIGKLAIYLNVLDEDYDYESDDDSNKEVLTFLRSDKETGQILLEHVRTKMSIKDEDGNEYKDEDGNEYDIFDGLNI